MHVGYCNDNYVCLYRLYLTMLFEDAHHMYCIHVFHFLQLLALLSPHLSGCRSANSSLDKLSAVYDRLVRWTLCRKHKTGV